MPKPCWSGCRTVSSLGALLLFCLCLPAMAGEALPEDIATILNTADSRRSLAEGKVLSGRFHDPQAPKAISLWLARRIPAATTATLAAIRICAGAPRHYPMLRACRIVEPGERQEIIHHRLKLHWLLPAIEYRFRARYRKVTETLTTVRFDQVSGDLRYLGGGWNLYARGRQTLAVYFISIQPRAGAPRGWIRQLLEEQLPESMQTLTRLATRKNQEINHEKNQKSHD